MQSSAPKFDYDVFISYRWVEPDQSWVRERLAPALDQAGLCVCLDVNDFVPGRDLILEMTRAGHRSKHALCVLSKEYFDEGRMVHFESLMARRSDPGGTESRLIPLVLRPTEIPEWLRGLVPVDWTDPGNQKREWKRLLRVLGAKRLDVPTPEFHIGVDEEPDTPKPPAPVFIHDYLLPRYFIGRAKELKQLDRLLCAQQQVPRIIAITAIGGIGKSCLSRQLVDSENLRSIYSPIIWFSFYDARGEDDKFFFSEMLTQGFHWADSEKPLEGIKETVRLRKMLTSELDSRKALLVLDGFELLQLTDDPAARKYGSIHKIYGEIERLLKHVLNGSGSTCIVTSRVPLRDFDNSRGYVNFPLDIFSPTDGADLLFALGVEGMRKDLELCSKLVGGHALSLVAAGKYLARKKIPARQFSHLTGNPDVFQQSPEGERVKRIVDWYKDELTPEQQYFLTRLSLHQLPVTRQNFPVLVPGYPSQTSEEVAYRNIIDPLVERGLVDRLDEGGKELKLAAHPLMKLAFATWLEPEEKKRAHEEWARAAASAPGLFLNVEEASLEELQPLVDAVEQYLAADDPQGAWRIFQYRKVGWRLAHLGYFELVLKLSKLFERVSAKWEITDRLYLIDRIAWAFNRLESQDEEIAYRKKMLELAKKLPPDDAEKVRAAVIPTLLGMGRIQDAELLRSTDPHIRGRILLAKGKYKTASHLLNKEFKMSTGHARTSSAQTLGEALYRNGELSRAEDILRDGLDLATKLEYECCRMSIYSCLTDVALRRRSTTEARQWWDRRTELRRQLNFDDDYNSWLLAVEGDYEAALTALGNEKSGTIRHRISYWIGKARILAFQHKIKEANAALRTAQRLVTKSRFGQFNDEASAIAADLTERRGAS